MESATLVTDSFVLDGTGDDDPTNDYMEFTIQVSIPMLTVAGDDATTAACNAAYGPALITAGYLAEGQQRLQTAQIETTGKLDALIHIVDEGIRHRPQPGA